MRLAEKRWYKDPDNATKLNALLLNPVLREAMDLVIEIHRPNSNRGDNALIDNALNNAKMDGLWEFKHTLEQLANPTQEMLIQAGAKEIPNLPKAWTHFQEEKTSFPVDNQE